MSIQERGAPLKDKVVIITGSAAGIGRFVAGTFADAGAKVVVSDIASLDTVTKDLRDRKAEVLGVPTDVRSEEQVKALMDKTIATFGRIDILVNNAGIVTHFSWGIPPWPRVRYMDIEFWDKVFNTNLRGPFLCTKHVLPTMESQGSGHIVSTMGGASPKSIGSMAYGVSKEALRVFTQFVAEEEREYNVCVVTINPGEGSGQIATENAPEEAQKRLLSPKVVGNRFVIAAQAGMEFSGQHIDVRDGKLGLRVRSHT